MLNPVAGATSACANRAADPESLPRLYTRFAREPWEVTPDHATAWVRHRFRGQRGLADSLRALIGDEWGLLLTDLEYYHGMRRRWEQGTGPEPPPAHEYLRPGREHWGWLKEAVELVASAAGEEERVPELDDPLDLRDRALRLLAEARLSAAELCNLKVVDANFEDSTLWFRDEWHGVSPLAMYYLDCYLDTRGRLEDKDPLFASQHGYIMTTGHVRRLLGGGA
jgi:integrase